MRVLAIAVAILPAITYVHADWSPLNICPQIEVDRFTPLATDPTVEACMKATGVNLLPAHNMPGPDKYVSMCAVPVCLDVYAIVKPMSPLRCRMMVGSPEFMFDIGSMLDDLEKACQFQTPSPSPLIKPIPATAAPSPTKQTPPSTPVATPPAPVSLTPARSTNSPPPTAAPVAPMQQSSC